ncbi:tetratricopeptide repeat protein [Acidovorax sp.]|uniref:tetratricopeptide repeat protein n=1 Tax=Acidovorax sp. TaxID=1872122 RepID=UPI0039E6DE65
MFPENPYKEVAAYSYWRGIAALETKRLDDAVMHLSRAVAFAPRHDNARYRLGRALMATGNDDVARGCFLQVLENDKEHFLANVFMHDICKKQGDAEGAMRYLSEAKRIHPDSGSIGRRE